MLPRRAEDASSESSDHRGLARQHLLLHSAPCGTPLARMATLRARSLGRMVRCHPRSRFAISHSTLPHHLSLRRGSALHLLTQKRGALVRGAQGTTRRMQSSRARRTQPPGGRRRRSGSTRASPRASSSRGLPQISLAFAEGTGSGRRGCRGTTGASTSRLRGMRLQPSRSAFFLAAALSCLGAGNASSPLSGAVVRCFSWMHSAKILALYLGVVRRICLVRAGPCRR